MVFRASEPSSCSQFLLHVSICHCLRASFDRKSELFIRSLQGHSSFCTELVFRLICDCLVRMSLLGFPPAQNHHSWALLLVFLVWRRWLAFSLDFLEYAAWHVLSATISSAFFPITSQLLHFVNYKDQKNHLLTDYLAFTRDEIVRKESQVFYQLFCF